MDTITLEWLKQRKAPKECLEFFERNKLEGFPVDGLGEIEGDFNNFVWWVKCVLDCKFEYNKHGNVITEIVSSGYFVKHEYDKQGNKTKEIHPSGHTYQWKYEYDRYDNLIKEVHQNGIIYQWRYEYDEYGNMTKEIYPNGEVCQYEYDDLGNMIKEINSDGRYFQYEYEYYGNGQLKSIHEDGEQSLFIPKF